MSPVSAWDAGANSVQSEDGDCECVFTMQQVSGVYVGFTVFPESVPARERLTHAFSFSGRKFQIMEAGTGRTSPAAFSDGDEFRIRRVGLTVTYLHNDSVIYTSKVPAYGVLQVGCALYASGDFIV